MGKKLLELGLDVMSIKIRHPFFMLGSLCLLAFAGFLIYLPSELGAALTIPPDSSEYSICLANLLEQGRFGLTLNGEWYPSRYTPWFSLLFLSPAYFLSAGNVLCMHWPILAFALALLVAVWKLGSLCGLGKLSILPPLLLMFMPDFLFYSRIAMTDIPYSALVVIIAVLFMHFAYKDQISARLCFFVGLLVAWAGLARSTGFTLSVPFGIVVLIRRGNRNSIMHTESSMSWGRKIVLLLSLVLPIVVAQCLGMVYNWSVFGSPFRSGYHYWCAVPFDFPDFVFNLKYIVPTVKYLLRSPIIQTTLAFLCVPVAFALYVVLTKDTARHRALLLLIGYELLHLFVLLCLYLGFYWSDTRFFLPVTIASVPLFFATINVLLSKVSTILRGFLIMLVFAVSIMGMSCSPARYLPMAEGRSVWLAAAQISSAVLPAGSVVIQQGDPNVLDYFGFRDKRLALLPFRREFDYVQYMVAPTRISHLIGTPESIDQLIIPELVASGVCKLPFPYVFEERPDIIREYLSQGKRVFSQQGYFYSKIDAEILMKRVEDMGLELRFFGMWNVPGISPNPVRHFYDKLVFWDDSMDLRPEITVAYYEILKKE